MRAVLDACVLFPTILREILIGTAQAGVFVPVWSQRILDEWTHAALRLGPDQARIAGVEAALLASHFPGAMVPGDDAGLRGLDLPDPADAHVVATALACGAEVIVTANLRDFPRSALAAVGLRAQHPDPFLLDCLARGPQAVQDSVTATHRRALQAGGRMDLKPMLKKARLPRLARAVLPLAQT